MNYAHMLFADARQSASKLIHTDAAFVECVSRLRQCMASKRETIDKYVIAFLRILDSNGALFMRDYGFDTAVSEFRYLLRIYRDNPTQTFDHPFFPIMQKYIASHPCPKEAFYVEYYFVKLMPQFINHAIDALETECLNRIASLYRQESLQDIDNALQSLLSRQDYENLNHVLLNRFILVPASNIFLQILIEETSSAYISGDEKNPEILYHVIFGENEGECNR